MRSYELMYILDPGLDEDASGALLGRVEEVMSKQGVEVEKTEPWGKRRLAYPIKGHWEGNYVLSYLKAEPSAVSEMERRLRVTDGILRFLTVRTDAQKAKLARRQENRDEKSRARKARRVAKAGASAGADAPAPAAKPATEVATPAAAEETKPTAEAAAPAAEEGTKPEKVAASEIADPDATVAGTDAGAGDAQPTGDDTNEQKES